MPERKPKSGTETVKAFAGEPPGAPPSAAVTRRDPGEPLPAGALALLSKAQIAELIGICVRKLESMIAAGEYPKPDMRVGRLPRWRTETHNAWVGRTSPRTGPTR